jgi:hypothetical protein
MFTYFVIVFFGTFLKITKLAQKLGKINATILTKMGWATFWVNFLQTHLVALVKSWKFSKLTLFKHHF